MTENFGRARDPSDGASPATDDRIRRIGHNEALYRQVNERIESLNDAFSPLTANFLIVCECGDLHCMEQIPVSRGVYERARQEPTLFIARPGHEASDIETVVEADPEGEYIILAKGPPEARRLANETNPRS